MKYLCLFTAIFLTGCWDVEKTTGQLIGIENSKTHATYALDICRHNTPRNQLNFAPACLKVHYESWDSTNYIIVFPDKDNKLHRIEVSPYKKCNWCNGQTDWLKKIPYSITGTVVLSGEKPYLGCGVHVYYIKNSFNEYAAAYSPIIDLGTCKKPEKAEGKK